MFKKQTFLPLALFLSFCTFFAMTTPSIVVAKEQAEKNSSFITQQPKLTDVVVTKTPTTTTITITAEQSLTDYTVKTLGGTGEIPPRMYIDIKGVDAGELIQSKSINTSVAQVRSSSRGDDARIVFSSASSKLFTYRVQPVAEGLQIIVDESPQQAPLADTTLDELLKSSQQLIDSTNTTTTLDNAPASKVETAFFADDREHISVDFYKIDLHNVFRLLREVSGQNIIVDDSVSGSLTLALNDVPWDFALDIILNLKGLSKEERFNTIVIYPTDKAFVWPGDAVGSLSIEEAPAILAQSELIIEKAQQLPKEVLLAKEVLKKARRAEKSNNINKATELYIEAFDLWPNNPQIATRIATLYLVNLGINAKATYYAKKALSLDPQNIRAALYAAIASANMGRNAEAAEYFRQSISGAPPLREALVSFAAFNENNGNNQAALTLLKKLHSNYGETVNSMVAMARIYDKMGAYDKASQQYSALLASGFQIRSNLRDYIKERVQVGIQ